MNSSSTFGIVAQVIELLPCHQKLKHAKAWNRYRGIGQISSSWRIINILFRTQSNHDIGVCFRIESLGEALVEIVEVKNWMLKNCCCLRGVSGIWIFLLFFPPFLNNQMCTLLDFWNRRSEGEKVAWFCVELIWIKSIDKSILLVFSSCHKLHARLR